MVDKQSPLPMYYQIEEDIKLRIKQDEFSSGDSIPSERELSEMYGVSRMTVRQAVLNLVSSGLLYREKGRGTFVAEHKIEQPLLGMTSFTEDMKARGMEPSSKLLSFTTAPSSSDIARKLSLNESDEVYIVQRIRYADAKPMAIEKTYIPIKLFPELNEAILQGSFYSFVEGVKKQTIGRATQGIEAANATEDEAELLHISVPSAVLLIERLSYLQNGVPFEVVQSIYRADRYKFISNISRQ
ncbi:GntR family transcriptional regulator [Jeotgalibacillus soli]|uniref:HTH gntR-type domain-containing protein n=1 Tax=Jeotgalibacillus soli TaxID=889306 RepID=A0A0C2VKY5_9BACL|nr:GntR family transcriptional regulator [Jeotgalibacillus soli]KIL49532.1 hypothetical protein KP78_10000 [Jeotgalibacillus soli]